MNRRGFFGRMFAGALLPAVSITAEDKKDPLVQPFLRREKLTPDEEHELWRKDIVPPVHADDNDMRHIIAHMDVLRGHEMMPPASPTTFARMKRHLEEHQRKVRAVQERQQSEIRQAEELIHSFGVGTGNREDLLDIITN